VTLLYLGLTTILTWPVLPHLFEAVAGFDGRDSSQWVWFNWWGAKSLLALQQSPAHVTWLYYPLGADHPVLLATLFVPLMALPLTLVGGVQFAYNLVFLLSFVLGGTLFYLMGRSLVGLRFAAFLGGLIFIFAPNRMGHAMAGHLLLIATWSLPLFALAVIYLFRRPTWRWAGVGTVALTALVLTQPIHLAYFALPFSLVYGGAVLVSRPGWTRLRRTAVYAGGMAALTLLLLLPFYLPLLRASLQGEQEFFTNEGLEEHSTDLLAFVLPSPYHPFWRNEDSPPPVLSTLISSPRQMEERLAYLGLLPLALAVWAVVRGRPGVYRWLVLALLAAVLAMGPSLKVLDEITGLALPYRWLMDLPFLRWSRTPGRFNETTAFALAVLAAFGMAEIWPRLRGRRQQGVVAVLVTLFVLLEYLIYLPFPIGGQKMPEFYDRLATEPPPGPLLDMPVTGSRRASNYSLLYQTRHDRPIAGGYIERDPPGTAELAQFFDRLLSPSSAQAVIEQTPSLETRRLILAQNNVQQVTARRWLMTDQAATATLAFLPEVLGEPYYAGDEVLAWQAPAAGTASLPPYTLLVAEKRWETTPDGGQLYLKEQSDLFVYATHAGPAILLLDLQVGRPGQQLWVGNFGPVPAGEEPQQHQIPLELQAGFNWLPFRLANCQDCRAAFSRIWLGEN
jgi:hypothetical protein